MHASHAFLISTATKRQTGWFCTANTDSKSVCLLKTAWVHLPACIFKHSYHVQSSVQHCSTAKFFLFFFAKHTNVTRLFRNIHPSLQYSSHSRIHTSLYYFSFLTCTSCTMPLPLGYSYCKVLQLLQSVTDISCNHGPVDTLPCQIHHGPVFFLFNW